MENMLYNELCAIGMKVDVWQVYTEVKSEDGSRHVAVLLWVTVRRTVAHGNDSHFCSYRMLAMRQVLLSQPRAHPGSGAGPLSWSCTADDDYRQQPTGLSQLQPSGIVYA